MSNLTERERFKGWMILQGLKEQVSPVQMGKAYYHKEQIMTMVQDRILELAPHGVTSQEEFLQLLDKALAEADERAQKMFAHDEAKAADIELTLSMIERSLRMVPFQVFFAQNQVPQATSPLGSGAPEEVTVDNETSHRNV